jgi:hypothetical protein
MNKYYLLSTGAIFCCEEELLFTSDYCLVVNGLLSITGDDTKYVRVNSFRVDDKHIVAEWTK